MANVVVFFPAYIQPLYIIYKVMSANQAFRNDSKELNDKVTIPFFLTIPFFPKGTERNEERGEI